jgi:hypothetical protein
VLDKLFDGEVLNQDDKHELECLAVRDPFILQQILTAEQRLRREGNLAAVFDLRMIINRVTPETGGQGHAPGLEMMERGTREGGSRSPRSLSPSLLRHSGGHSRTTTHHQYTRLSIPDREQRDPNSPASGMRQARLTPRGAAAAAEQTRRSGTSPRRNQDLQQVEARRPSEARAARSREPELSHPITNPLARGNQRR